MKQRVTKSTSCRSNLRACTEMECISGVRCVGKASTVNGRAASQKLRLHTSWRHQVRRVTLIRSCPPGGQSSYAALKPPGVSDAAGQPAVPSQPHEGSLGALPLPLRPRGHLRRHGAQHRHRPRGLPAPQLHCRLSHRVRAQDAAEWCQHPLRPLQGPGRHDDGPASTWWPTSW